MILNIFWLFRTAGDVGPYRGYRFRRGGYQPPAISVKCMIFTGRQGAAPYHGLSFSVGADVRPLAASRPAISKI